MELELGGHRSETLHRRRPDRAQPRGAARSGRRSRPRGERASPVIGELELASRWLRGTSRRDHRHEGEVDDDDADRPDARGRRAARCSWAATSALALSAQVDDSTEDTIHVVEASSFQLEGDRHVSSVDRGDAELFAGPPRPARQRRRIRRREGAHLRRTRPPDDWAVLNADDPPSLALAGRARARRLLFSLSGALVGGRRRRGRHDRRAARRRGEQPLVPLAAIRLLGPHLVVGRPGRGGGRVACRRGTRLR